MHCFPRELRELYLRWNKLEVKIESCCWSFLLLKKKGRQNFHARWLSRDSLVLTLSWLWNGARQSHRENSLVWIQTTWLVTCASFWSNLSSVSRPPHLARWDSTRLLLQWLRQGLAHQWIYIKKSYGHLDTPLHTHTLISIKLYTLLIVMVLLVVFVIFGFEVLQTSQPLCKHSLSELLRD